jgi:small conductance mechanosensitive channel
MMPGMMWFSPFAQLRMDPNDLVDADEVGWEELVWAAIALAIAIVVALLLQRLVLRLTNRFPNIQPDVAQLIARLVSWTVILFGVVIALLVLGFQVGPVFLLIALVGGMLFISARPILENLGAGVLLQTEAPFKAGDLVNVRGVFGTVVEISARTTVIDTFDGRRTHIPNTDVAGDNIVNYSVRGRLRTELEVGVEYGTDLDRARDVIEEAMAGLDGVYADPSPGVFVEEFGDSSINFRVLFWHAPTRRFTTTDEVVRSIERSLRREGIVIAFPHMVVVPPRSGE